MFHRFVEFMPLTIINNRLVSFRIGNVEFRDSYAILPFALGSYKKTKIDYELFEEEVRTSNMPKIIDYLADDCKYTYELVSAFVAKFGPALTVAGAAMKYWKTMSDVPQTSSPRLDNFMRPYYFGGRVQVFKSGRTGKVKVVDINSAYPTAMLSDHAYGYDYITQSRLDGLEGADFCHIVCDSNGALPFRGDDGSLTFPIGRFEFQCTGWELLKAVELGLVREIKVIKIVKFIEKRNFSDYIHYFYEMKKTSVKGSTDYIFAKLMMNSLYGKFGTDPKDFVEYTIASPEYAGALNATHKLGGFLGEWAIAIEDSEQKLYYNVATAASITGFVRSRLMESIFKSKGVVYCDTDSIIAEMPVVDIGDKLGQWTDEGDGEGWIAGKKIYALKMSTGKHKIASKGVKFTYEDVEKLCKGESVIWESESPSFSFSRGTSFIKREIKV